MVAALESAHVKHHWVSLQEITSGVTLRGNFCLLQEMKSFSENKVGSRVVNLRMEKFQGD